MPLSYFVSAISTDSGKTLVSAILTQALKADYWKPIQSGLPKDADTVKSLVNFPVHVHGSAYEFAKPASPHSAAKAENRNIDFESIQLPQTSNHLVIEGAGGLLVPLNDTHFVADIAEKFNLELILVSNIYLGSINHTLLSVRELQRRNVQVKGIVFNGEQTPDTEDIILKYSGYRCLLRLRPEPVINQEVIEKYATLLLENLSDGNPPII